MLAVIGLILIVYRRGGHFQLNLAGLVNFAVDLPKHDVRAEIHYPILARAVADLGAIVQSKDYHSDLPKLYQDLLYGASRTGNGKECRVALMVPNSDHLLICKEVLHHSISAKAAWTFNLKDTMPATVAYNEKRIYNCSDVSKDALWKALPRAQANAYRSFVCVPVLADHQSYGLLLVDSPERNAFSKNAERDLQVYATFLATLLALEWVLEGRVF